MFTLLHSREEHKMYNYGKEHKKYLEEKEKEEAILRLLDFPEWKIQYLREIDDCEFNKTRSFYRFENPTKDEFFRTIPYNDHCSLYNWEKIISEIEDDTLYNNLKNADPVLQMIIIMLKNHYKVWEISEDLHITKNAIYKRIKNFVKKCQNNG